MINAQTIISEFKLADFKYVIENNPLGDLKYRQFFPLEFRSNLTFASIEATSGAKVMADIVAIGAKAPRKGREFVKSITGGMPKVEIARDLTEEDQITIQELRTAASHYPNNVSIANQLIDKIYEDPTFCLNGVNARLEWMAKRVVSNGLYESDIVNNAAGVKKVKIDFNITKTNASFDWFASNVDFATKDPIVDIRKIVEDSIATGFPVRYMWMSRSEFNQLVKFTSVQKLCASFSQAVLNNFQQPDINQVNDAFVKNGLPTIILWNSFVNQESKAGDITSTTGWELGNITFSTEAILGATQYTLTPEFNMSFPDVMAQTISDGFILVKTFGSQDPILVSSKATAFGTPVLYNTKRMRILKTKLS